jgi:hypothetical protein
MRRMVIEDGHTLVQFCDKKDSNIYHYASNEEEPFGHTATFCGTEGYLYGVNDIEREGMRLCYRCERKEQ